MDVQREAIAAYTACHQLPEATIWEDMESGNRIERAAYQQMLATLQTGDMLLVWRMDRVGRRNSEMFRLFEWCDEHGVALIERENTIARVLPAMIYRAEQGKWITRTPIGYRLPKPHESDYANGHLVPSPDAPRIALLWSAYLRTGNLMQASIEAQVTSDAAAFMLRNRAYCGDTVWRGIEVPDTHPPLVSRALWDGAYALITGRAAQAQKTPAAPSLLTSLLYLEDTPHRLYLNSNRARSLKPEWAHDYYATKQTHLVPVASVRRDGADALALDALRALSLTPRARQAYERDLVRVSRTDPDRAARAAAERERARIAAARLRAAEGYAAGLIDPVSAAALRDRHDREERENAARAVQLPPLPDLAAATPLLDLRMGLAQSVDLLLRVGDIVTLRRMIETLFRRLEIHDARSNGLRGRARTNWLKEHPPRLVVYRRGH